MIGVFKDPRRTNTPGQTLDLQYHLQMTMSYFALILEKTSLKVQVCAETRAFHISILFVFFSIKTQFQI